MKDRTRFWVYGLWFVLCLNLIAGIIGTWIYRRPIFVVPAVLISVALILFLALVDYQRLRNIRDRERALLERVKDAWVTSLNDLERFTPGISLIDLQYRECPNPEDSEGPTTGATHMDREVFETAAAAFLEPRNEGLNPGARYLNLTLHIVSRLLRARTSADHSDNVEKLFEQAQRSLLIRGPMGAGKTVSIMVLTRYLIRKASNDAGEPIPVVLSLASWNDQVYDRFQDWLVDELKLKYDLAEVESLNWLIGRRLLLILDGLDEVKERRKQCVTELDKFLRVFQPPGIVVACRTNDDDPAREKLPEPELRSRIEISPLTYDQISRYSGSPIIHFSQESIPKLAQHPLTLTLLLLVAKNLDRPVESLRKYDDIEVLLKAFVETQLDLEKQMLLPYRRGQLLRRLRWLAREMDRHRQPIFYIDGLQPSWLPERPLLSLRPTPAANELLTDRLSTFQNDMHQLGRGFKVDDLENTRSPERPVFRWPLWFPIAWLLAEILTFYSADPQRTWFSRPLVSIHFTKPIALLLRQRVKFSLEQLDDYQGIFDIRRDRKTGSRKQPLIPLRLPRFVAKVFMQRITAYIDRRRRTVLQTEPWIIPRPLRFFARTLTRLHLLPAARFQLREDRWIFADLNLLAYTFASRILATFVVMFFGYILMIGTNRGLGHFLKPEGKINFGLQFVTDTPWDWIFIAIVFGGGLAMALPDYWRFRKHNIDTRVKTTLTERGDFKNILANIGFCWIVFFGGAMLMSYLWPRFHDLGSSFAHVGTAIVDKLGAGPALSRSWAWLYDIVGQSDGTWLIRSVLRWLRPKGALFTFDIRTALGGATIYAISFGLVFWFRGVGRSPRSDIRTAEKVSLIGGSGRGALAGMVAGGILGIGPALLVAHSYGWAKPNDPLYVSALQFWPMSIWIGLIVGFVTGNFRKVSVIENTHPNYGLWLSLRNTVLIWLAVGAFSSLVIWVHAIFFIGTARATLQDALFLGSVVGMLVAFGYGGLDFLYHITLRLMLSLKGLAPFFQYGTFFDNVTHLGFLRRMGGGYMFLHGSLRDIFGEARLNRRLRPRFVRVLKS